MTILYIKYYGTETLLYTQKKLELSNVCWTKYDLSQLALRYFMSNVYW